MNSRSTQQPRRIQRDVPRWARYLSAIVAVVFAAIVGITAFSDVGEIRALRARGVAAEAVVVAASKQGAFSSWAELEFNAAGRPVRAHVSRLVFEPYPRVGDKVEIVYDSKMPTRAASPERIKDYGDAIAPGVIAVAFILLAGFALKGFPFAVLGGMRREF